MTALEIRPEEVGQFDLAAYRERQARMWRPVIVPVVPPPSPEEPSRRSKHKLDKRCYRRPIAPKRKKFREEPSLIERARMEAAANGQAKWTALVGLCCLHYHVTRDVLFSPRKPKELAAIRHELWWVASKLVGYSLPQMARASGGRDHTTVLHGIRRYQDLIDSGVVSSDLMAKAKRLPAFSESE